MPDRIVAYAVREGKHPVEHLYCVACYGGHDSYHGQNAHVPVFRTNLVAALLEPARNGGGRHSTCYRCGCDVLEGSC